MTRRMAWLWILLLVLMEGCSATPTLPILTSSPPIVVTNASPSPTTERTDNGEATIVPTVLPSATQLSPSPFPTLPITATPLGQSPTQPRIAAFRMITRNVGWAVQVLHEKNTGGSWILRTTDGLASWAVVSPPLPEANFETPVAAFVDENTAIAIYVQFADNTPDTQMTAWITSDGGKNWKAGETTQFNQIDNFRTRQLQMDTPNHGWMLGTGSSGMEGDIVIFLATNDGGLHWTQIYNTKSHLNDPQNQLWIIGDSTFNHLFYVLTSQARAFFSNSRLSTSKDGGLSWQSQLLEPPAEYPNMDVTGSDNTVESTTSIPEFATATDGALIRRVFRHDQVTFPPISYQGLPQAEYIYSTLDGGKTWTSQLTPATVGTVHYLNATIGWFLGKSDPDPTKPTQLFQTRNDGKTWTLIAADCPLPLGSEMQFIDDQTGFAFVPLSYYYASLDARVQAFPYLLTTQDGGKTWTTLVVSRVTP